MIQKPPDNQYSELITTGIIIPQELAQESRLTYTIMVIAIYNTLMYTLSHSLIEWSIESVSQEKMKVE